MKKAFFILSILLFWNLTFATHPKLLFDSSDYSTIWSTINNPSHTNLKGYYDYLKDEAYSNRTDTYTATSSRIQMHWASDLAFISLIDEAESSTYLDNCKTEAIRSIDSIYSHATSISTGNLAQASALMHMSLVYDMLYNVMNSTERYNAATKIKQLIDNLINEYYDISPVVPNAFTKRSNKTFYGNNHQVHVACAVGIGAIAIKGDNLDASTVFSMSNAERYIDVAYDWVTLLDENLFATDGSNFEGISYGLFSIQPMIAFYEILDRCENIDCFNDTNLKNSIEWIVNELLPVPAANSSVSVSLFDYNNGNATYNCNVIPYSGYTNKYHGAASRSISIYAVLGGVFDSITNHSEAGTWLFNENFETIDTYDSTNGIDNYFGPINIMAFTKYNHSTTSLNSISGLNCKAFYQGRGLVVRDGYNTDGTLFIFDTNYYSNKNLTDPSDLDSCCVRWDEDDNNSFTFYSFGDRWVIDNGRMKDAPNYEEEKSDYHNTVLVDGNTKPYVNNNDLQVSNWYDYHYTNGINYITSDITDAWLKKIRPLVPYDGIGEEIIFNTDAAYSTVQKYTTFNKDRRHAQFIEEAGNIPPYVIIYDDIEQGISTSRDYTFVLNTGANNTVSFNSTSRVATISNASSGNEMNVHYFPRPTSDFLYTTDTINPDWDDSHTRIKYTVEDVTNPHFHVILIPEQSTTATPSVSIDNISTNNASIAEIEFASEDIVDYSMFNYEQNVSGTFNSSDFSLLGHSAPLTSATTITGVMGYCRQNTSTGEYTDIFLSRGSYLEMNDTELVNVGGVISGSDIKTARVILNDDEINIYKEATQTGRKSYKIYGPDVSEFKIYDQSVNFTNFNDYNYYKSSDVLSNYYYYKVSNSQYRIYWSCDETHDLTIYSWRTSSPNTINTTQLTAQSAGIKTYTLNTTSATDWNFRIEAKMTSDNFINISEPLNGNIRGTITSNTTWDGYYLIDGDLTVNSGVTLTIEDGSIINFYTGDAISSGRDLYKTELIINGVLNASGSTFRSYNNTTNGWYGICFEQAQDNCIINNCDIERSYRGTLVNDCNPTISNNHFNNNQMSARIIGGTGEFSGNLIENGSYSFYITGSITSGYSLIDDNKLHALTAIYAASDTYVWASNNQFMGHNSCSNIMYITGSGTWVRAYNDSYGGNEFDDNYSYYICKVISGTADIEYNNIGNKGTTSGDWMYNSGGTLNAEYNYWNGLTPSSSDFYGTVDYSPFRTVPWSTAGPSWKKTTSPFLQFLSQGLDFDLEEAKEVLLDNVDYKSAPQFLLLLTKASLKNRDLSIVEFLDELSTKVISKKMSQSLLKAKMNIYIFNDKLVDAESIVNQTEKNSKEENALLLDLVWEYAVREDNGSKDRIIEKLKKQNDEEINDIIDILLENVQDDIYSRKNNKLNKNMDFNNLIVKNPSTFMINAYPNPFNPSTTINYNVASKSFVTIKIYNLLGKEIKHLYQGEREQGNYTIIWDGKSNNGNSISSGIYIVKFISGENVLTKKITLLK